MQGSSVETPNTIGANALKDDVRARLKEAGVTKVWQASQLLGYKINRQTVYNVSWGYDTTFKTLEIVDKAIEALKGEEFQKRLRRKFDKKKNSKKK